MNTKKNKVVVRMPPSPTGYLHLGTARTALFNWCFAKTNQGKIIFRWEDTDRERSQKKFEEEILAGLAWLGMDFIKESSGFFRQSQCKDIHKKYLEKLWKEKKIFPCFVSASELDALRQKSREKKQNFVFWSPFRDLSADKAEEKMKTESFVWRFRTPKNEWINFRDKIRGKITTNTETLGDFVIARADQRVLYYLANVIDDLTQGITHVFRGEDHISNTPKQILLYRALGGRSPEFGHIPLVLDRNRKKLSKRNTDPSICVLVRDFQKKGFIPEGVINGLAFLGWNPKSTREIFSLSELCEDFEISNVNSGAAMYDSEKMKWFNAQWMRKISLSTLSEYYLDFSGQKVEEKFLALAREKARDLIELQDELKYLVSDPGFTSSLFVHEKMNLSIDHGKEMIKKIREILVSLSDADFCVEKIREISLKYIEKQGLKNGEFMWPFRVALSNRKGSAGPFEIAAALGKAETLKRLSRATK